MNNHPSDLFQRHKLNPILTAANWPYQAHSIFNPGATLLADGTTLLLCRVEDRRGHSHLCATRSANGIDNWQIDSKPTFMPDPEHYPDELWGVEDSRITYALSWDNMPSYIQPMQAAGRVWLWRSQKISTPSNALV